MYESPILRALDQIEKSLPKVSSIALEYQKMVDRQTAQIQSITKTYASLWDSVSNGVNAMLKMVRDSYPPNWPTDSPFDIELVQPVIEQGISVFYVPRSEIVEEILEAPDFSARLAVIEARSSEIAHDCSEALAEPMHEQVRDRAILAQKAVEAHRDGHFEAAQALAVVVCDSYLKTHITGGYKKMIRDLTLGNSDEEAMWPLLRVYMPLATAVPFLEEWFPDDEDPAPITFSRHATIHGASTQQLNQLHATLAIMLAVTLTRALSAGFSRYGQARPERDDKETAEI